MQVEDRPDSSSPLAQQGSAAGLLDRYQKVRSFTEKLCEPLATEDYVVQTITDVSPTKWHLAHTSWFFETFLLKEYLDGYEPVNETYAYLFNSYYVQAGPRHCRDQRGYISRPTVEEVYDFRHHVDEHMLELLEQVDEEMKQTLAPKVEIGLHHEQQHQELLLTDIKHVFSVNPLRPPYRGDLIPSQHASPSAMEWVGFGEGLYEVGFEGGGFHFDNEAPRHRHFLESFELASRPVTNSEFMAFMEDDGYERPELWLSDGWATVQENDWKAPFYWEEYDGQWYVYTMGGMREVNPAEPVCHVSYYEADAYARWADARLPTEQEWEVAAQEAGISVEGNLVEEGHFHPQPARGPTRSLQQMFGDTWEWTRSQYEPYPGFEPLDGALGEYNGKFMSNKFVARGGSCATSLSHIRPTYRNFFVPESTWQFFGFRLARDV